MRRGVPVRTLLAALCVAASVPAAVSAQTVGITTVQNLSFGQILPGMTQQVTVNDAGRAEVVVSARGRITIVIELPAALQAAGGATVPVTFGAADGLYQIGTGQLRSFDPRSPLSVNITGSSGTLRIFVGGTVAAPVHQVSGAYVGAMTLQVVSD